MDDSETSVGTDCNNPSKAQVRRGEERSGPFLGSVSSEVPVVAAPGADYGLEQS